MTSVNRRCEIQFVVSFRHTEMSATDRWQKATDWIQVHRDDSQNSNLLDVNCSVAFYWTAVWWWVSTCSQNEVQSTVLWLGLLKVRVLDLISADKSSWHIFYGVQFKLWCTSCLVNKQDVWSTWTFPICCLYGCKSKSIHLKTHNSSSRTESDHQISIHELV